MMIFVEQLKVLAKGIDPDTGEDVGMSSIINSVSTVRLLHEIIDELERIKKFSGKNKKKQFNEYDKRVENRSKGRPERSHFPWNEEELSAIKDLFKKSIPIREIARRQERSETAIAIQLERMALISEEELKTIKSGLTYGRVDSAVIS